MDYKKIIKSRKNREHILRLLRFVPDKAMVKIQYRIKTGRKLNLKNPQRYTEKLQWYKLYYKNPILHECVDKYDVREYVKSKGLEEILVKLYAKYDATSEINWDSLPESFVMKSTNGGGGLDVIICPSKNDADIDDIKTKIVDWDMPIINHTGGREWVYYGLKAGIVIEELLINKENPKAGINDYKFFCYNGIPQYVVLDVDRYIGHKRNFYDTDWNYIDVESDCPSLGDVIPKPEGLNEMLKVASKLSEGFPHVRVDLYYVDGKVYFGELTFYPWSGYVQFSPDEFDFELGSKFSIERVDKK